MSYYNNGRQGLVESQATGSRSVKGAENANSIYPPLMGDTTWS